MFRRVKKGLSSLLAIVLVLGAVFISAPPSAYAIERLAEPLITPATPLNQPVETVYSGTDITFDDDDDGVSNALPMGFDFNFYGTVTNSVYASSNGLLMFENPSSSCCDSGNTLPLSDPAHYITPFYSDLYVGSNSKVMYTTIGSAPNRKFVIQFTNMLTYDNSNHPNDPFGTFQAILYESTNDIQFQYPNLVGIRENDAAFGSDALIGLQSLTGQNVTYSQLEKSLTEKQAIRFSPNDDLSSYTISSQTSYEPILLTTSLFPDSPLLASPADGAFSTLNPTFQWDNSAGASSYRLLVATDPEFLLSSIVVDQSGITENSSSVNELLDGIAYYWKVVAENNDEIIFSNTFSFKATSKLPPTVDTDANVSNITSTTVTAGGNITSDGGDSVTERGVVYSVNANPTMSDGKVTADSGGTGTFSVNLTGLQSESTYHIRAYATNVIGTSYGPDVTFTTLSSNANINTLSLSGIALDQTVNGSVYTYTASVPNDVTVTSVTYTMANNYASVDLQLDGNPISNPINLNVGQNVITILVTAQDGTPKTYTITVTRAEAPSFGGGGGGPTGGTDETDLSVTIDGKTEQAIAAATTSEQDGQTVLTVTVDALKLSEQLANAGNKPVVVIPVTASADKVTTVLKGDAIKAMENKNAILEIQTPNGSYKLPASEVLIDQLSEQLGAGTKIDSITVQVDIAKSDNAKVDLLANAAHKGGFTVVIPPVDFSVTVAFGDKKVQVTKFNSYVEREIPLPEGVDASEISTAVVLNEDGTTRAIPTKLFTRDGVTYAVINSLTNSTYAVVWNPVAFEDVKQHWSKDAVNDMGSRMIISGVGNGMFNPNQDITRAEFAAIIVRGLGLELESGSAPFSDVKESSWYNDVVKTAHANNLINGYEDGTFRPNDKITREQAMLIISKAMAIMKLSDSLSNPSTEVTLRPYQDVTEISAWALYGIADTVQAGIVSGRSSTELAPKDNMTRAEVAVIIERLLRKSDLI